MIQVQSKVRAKNGNKSLYPAKITRELLLCAKATTTTVPFFWFVRVFPIIPPHENIAPHMVYLPLLGGGGIGYLTTKLGGGL